MKKILRVILTLLLFMPLTLKAVSNANYSVDKILIDAKLDIAGNMNVKEILKVDGTYNGYLRELIYENTSLPNFTGKESDFESSNIYNASNINVTKVGLLENIDTLDYNIFTDTLDIKEFSSETSANSGDKRKYIQTATTHGVELKMYNETIKSNTYFYIEYTIGNVAVLHNDCAELYYNFIGNSLDDHVNEIEIRLGLPYTTTEELRVWAHADALGEINRIVNTEETPNVYYGAYLKAKDVNPNTPIDIRMVYPKEMISVDHPYLKKSNVNALDLILKVEQKRADEINKKIEKSKKYVKIAKYSVIAYLIGIITLVIDTYIKHDKEYANTLNSEYNREFIDDYDVEIVEFLMTGIVSEKGFSASILNLIYKKKIKAEKTSEKKENYKFTKLSDDGISEAEKVIMDTLFNDIGNGEIVTLKEIKSYAKKTTSNGTSAFYEAYKKWRSMTLETAHNQKFYESKGKTKVKRALFSLIGFALAIILGSLGFSAIWIILILIVSIIYIIYIISFSKRSFSGNNHYNKWKAFKKFLEDFGRFDEKELPEIKLWERYLVYATIFGIADKVQKTMQLKIKEMNIDTTNINTTPNYIFYNSLSSDISKSMTESVRSSINAVAQAQASSASGSGFGGGFSGGGGFGGGGGGGHGF